MSVLEFEGIHREFARGRPVLDGVTFNVEAGEVVSLLGRNGAGKTTLLHMAMGMLEPQGGTVRVFGMDPRRRPLEVKRRVGFVSESQILPAFLRVGDVVDLHRRLFPTWDEDLARDLTERFEIPMRRRVKALSKGQARQVALVAAMAHRPDLLLLDEPAGGLDPIARRDFLENAIRLLADTGTTIVFSSHYLSDVERLAGRVVLLHGARVLVDSALDDLREEYSLALVPYGVDGGRAALRELEAVVGVRQRSDALHAVLRLPPEPARKVLSERLGIDAVCRSVALEELFIELVGGQAGVAVPTGGPR